MNSSSAAQHYAKMNKRTGIEDANPHQLIMMLYQGALDSLQQAIGQIERRDFEGKGKLIGRAITIISGLQTFLDHEKGGEISMNLDRLYDYMVTRLYEATRDNDIAVINEVVGLLKEIKAGWDGIAQEANEIYAQQHAGA